MEYIAYLCRDGYAGYGVRFPDLPELRASGRTLGEARERAAYALTELLGNITARGEALPEASSLDDLAGGVGIPGAVVMLVGAEAPEKTVRVNITARASQLEEIDRLARVAGMTRSAFLVQTAIREGAGWGRMPAD